MYSLKISIIIPFYNAEKYLRQCLDSIISQTYDNWECLLINDGSTDSSDMICQEFVDQDERFKLYNNTNHGVSYSRNYGIAMALGEWVFFLDADDWMECDLFEKYLRYIDEVDMICGGFTEFGFSDNQFCIKTDVMIKDKSSIVEYDSPQIPIKKLLIYCWGKLFRKSVISHYNIQFREDLKLAEDFIFVTNYLCCTQKIAIISYNGIHYRTLPTKNKYCMNSNQYSIHAKAMNEVLNLASVKIGTQFKREYKYLELLLFSKFLSYIKSTNDSLVYAKEVANYKKNRVFDVASYYRKKGDFLRYVYYRFLFAFPSLSFKFSRL